jgi:hypothetical protein
MGVEGGLNKDLEPKDLAPGEYSDVHNLRMKNNRLILAQGYSEIFEPLPVAPEHMVGIIQDELSTIIIAGGGQIHKNQSAAWSDISRAVGGAYSTTGDWNSAILNGCVFMNNGIDRLQVLEVGDTLFKDSVGLTAGLTAKVFRSFKNYLFALNLNEGGTLLTQSLRWSDPADPGTEPPSWDVTDPTTQAGQTVLADTKGYIVDAKQLRDKFIIYKTDAVYSCQFIGGVYVFSFQKIISDRGLLSEGCVSTFEENHFVVGFDDIYIHDGLQAKSISEGRVKEFFYKDLDQSKLESAFTVTHQKEKEVWICYPNDEAINGSCNKALVWNWVSNVWYTRDIPNVIYGALSIVDSDTSDLWDAGADTTWDLGDLHWDANNYSPANSSLVLVSKEDDRLYQLLDTLTFNGTPFNFTLERLSFDMGQGDNVKYLNHLTPDITGQGVISSAVGVQNNVAEGINWKPSTVHTVGNFRLYSRAKGRYFSFNLSGNTLDCQPLIKSLDPYLAIDGEK